MLSFVLSLLLSVSHAADNSCEGVLGSAPSSTVYESLSTEARAAMTELAGLRITVDLERIQGSKNLADQLERELLRKQAELVKAFSDLNIMSEQLFLETLGSEIARLQGDQLISSDQDRIEREEQQQSIIHNMIDGSRMIFHRIEPGSFTMGDPEKPQEQVPVEISKPFEMMATQITQILWRKVTELAILKFSYKYKITAAPSYFKGALHPVEQVSYEDVQLWIRALNELSQAGEPALLDLIPGHKQGDVYRLPTEAEWEFVVRGRGEYKSLYHFGDDESQLDKYAWFRENSEEKTHPVATKDPLTIEDLKFYDLHGNVREWVQDRYQRSLPGGKDPTGSAKGYSRLLRGGSWSFNAQSLRSANRSGDWPDGRSQDVGFRLVRTIN